MRRNGGWRHACQGRDLGHGWRGRQRFGRRAETRELADRDGVHLPGTEARRRSSDSMLA